MKSHALYTLGLKRTRNTIDDDSIVFMLERIEDRASEREERMRRMELEMLEKMREREDRHEERMLQMFTAFMSASQPYGHSQMYSHQPFDRDRQIGHPHQSYNIPPYTHNQQ